MRWECRERFSRYRLERKPLVSDPGMHHGTCVTHVPWCMSGSLTWWGQRSRHSMRMRNPRSCISGKRPIHNRNKHKPDYISKCLVFRETNTANRIISCVYWSLSHFNAGCFASWNHQIGLDVQIFLDYGHCKCKLDHIPYDISMVLWCFVSMSLHIHTKAET